MDLVLERPLVFFDIESTGTNPYRDRIVEIAVIKVMPDGSRQEIVRRINPTIPIPAGASAVHGIYDADVAEAPTFDVIAHNLFKYLENCDLAGYNIVKFDVPMLQEEFKRCNLELDMRNRKLIDVFNIFCRLYPRNLSAAYKFFCGGDLEDAHSALADTDATVAVLLGQLAKHPELPREMAQLAEFSAARDADFVDSEGRLKFSGDEVVINFGKNSGRRLRDLVAEDPGFLRWMLRSDFSEDVKKVIKNALAGEFPRRPC
ncbi:MAG: 3'-5' exonuclease [Lentisphaerae bacterium]|nr:3'-5' exonuclease [Lentisphaerota bacterium]